MRGEIKEMDLYLQGYVFGIVVCPDEESDNVLESVWGFIGDPDADWIVSEAKEMAEGVRHDIDKREAEERSNASWAARNEIATVS